ncbi:MAG: hypothetical protein ACPF9Z_08155, partial [Paracoccaceae bacterium]
MQYVGKLIPPSGSSARRFQHSDLLAHLEQQSRHEYRKCLPVTINGVAVAGMLDSGNTFENVISQKLFRKLQLSDDDLEPLNKSTVGTAKKNVQLRVLGRVNKPLKMRLSDAETNLIIKPVVIDSLAMDLNLSGPWMKKMAINQMHSQDSIQFQGRMYPLIASIDTEMKPEVVEADAYFAKDVEISPMTEKIVPLMVPDVVQGQLEPGDFSISGDSETMSKYDVNLVRRGLVRVQSNGKTVCRILNTSSRIIRVPAGKKYGKLRAATEDVSAMDWKDEIVAIQDDEPCSMDDTHETPDCHDQPPPSAEDLQ